VIQVAFNLNISSFILTFFFFFLLQVTVNIIKLNYIFVTFSRYPDLFFQFLMTATPKTKTKEDEISVNYPFNCEINFKYLFY
jgi:hypothetical protein